MDFPFAPIKAGQGSPGYRQSRHCLREQKIDPLVLPSLLLRSLSSRLAIHRALRQTGLSMLCFPRSAALLLLLATSLAAQQPKIPAMPDNVIYEPNLDYAPAVGGKLAMDIVRPRDGSGAPHPTVLCIHGGGFRAGARQSYLPLCIELAQRGYVAATV